MRKRGTGPLVVLTLIIALGTIAQSYRFDQSLARTREAALATDRGFGSIDVSLAELRAAQAGYVATGQSADYWMTRVAEIMQGIDGTLAALTSASTAPDARVHYESAALLVGEVKRLDERARDNARRDQKYLASDLVFMDGLEASRRLSAELAQARAVESGAASASLARQTWMQFGMHGLALAFVAVVMLFYARSAARTAGDAEQTDRQIGDENAATIVTAPSALVAPSPIPAGAPAPSGATAVSTPAATPPATPAPPAPAAPPPTIAVAINLNEAAELCVDLARVMDTRDLPALLGRAARVLDAKGVVLWMADEDRTSLRPSLAHGYADTFVRRLGALPVEGDSVTSAAFRSMKAQTVNSPTPKGNGAIAVPLITAGGCLGVLAAEIRQSKPSGERTAIARVIAAQFAALVAPAADAGLETPAAREA